MSRLMFVYLSGSEKGKTRIFAQNPVSIGASDKCDLKLVPEEGGSLPEDALAQVYDDEGVFHLVPNIDSEEIEIRVNGEEVNGDTPAAGYEIHDGDTIHFGQGLSSAKVLFQIMPENFTTASLAPRNNRAIEQPSNQPVHPLTATLFVKELAASLWAEVPRRAKMIGFIASGILGLILLSFAYLFGVTLYRNTSEMETLRRQLEEEQEQRQKDRQRSEELDKTIKQIQAQDEQNRLFAQRISERYSPGVCLIAGSYIFVESGTGRILRYETTDDANEPPVDQSGNLLASINGAGPPVSIDYTGTGFLVGEGLLLTNKHVVRPWVTDQVAQIVMQQGNNLRPRLESLKAFFPSIQTSFALKEAEISQRYDVALCKFDQEDTAIPVLPLDTDDPQSLIGQPIVLLGYPTGVDGLLQRIEENERNEILKGGANTTEEVADALAKKGLIRPLTSTGNVGDALPGRIAHTAPTTEGGSGSPMFDRDGKVIGINSAILTREDGSNPFGGSNFGVPIKVATELIESYKGEGAKKAD